MQYRGWIVVYSGSSWIAWKGRERLEAATEEELQQQIDQREEGE